MQWAKEYINNICFIAKGGAGSFADEPAVEKVIRTNVGWAYGGVARGDVKTLAVLSHGYVPALM